MNQNQRASKTTVLIIGGGVIGLTTGLILKLHGFEVTIKSKDNLLDADPKVGNYLNPHSNEMLGRPADIASLHAAASIIPHSVKHPSSSDILEISQEFFTRLEFSAGFGVRSQRHYELYEDPNTKPPEYATTVKGYTRLKENGEEWTTNRSIPRRKNSDGVWGWYFDAFFVEVPTYLQSLYRCYRAIGGKFERTVVEKPHDVNTGDFDIIVNCSGRWATQLFYDPKETNIVRGHLVKVGIHEIPQDKDGNYFSYNYCPSLDVYSRSQNDKGEPGKFPADVYFYPRSDGWILGGSRQVGNPELDKNPSVWRDEDEQTQKDKDGKPITFTKEGKDRWGIHIPAPIWNLNKELLLSITGVDIDARAKDGKSDLYPSFAYTGYRFSRDPIRIEVDEQYQNRLVIHNYGHGGAGYTLSWGSAFEVLKLIEEKLNPKIETKPREGLTQNFDGSMERILIDIINDKFHFRNKIKFSPEKETNI